MVVAPNRNITKWVILLILILVALILGIVLPGQLVNNPSAAGSLELGPPETQETLNLSAPIPSQPVSQGSVFNISGTAATTQKTNCTYSVLYWVNHVERWPAQIIVNNLNYTKDYAITWVAADPVGVFTLLFTQFHVAYLNILSGADASSVNQA